ncbi:MAG: ATP-binding protein [Rikenellaceae bacterium]|nr:ATP-binding protein [Rikenellaceae bacterium]MCL2692090.1 ATP-binding protein [Rikenellaceae bacterium]
MKIKTIPSGAAIVGLVMAVCGAGIVWLVGGRWWIAMTVAAVQFFAAWSMALWMMDRYAAHRLKPLYQVLFSRNVQMSDLNEDYESAAEIADSVEGELAVRDQRHRREIARLREQERYRKEYVGNVSHEIKTPIFNIQGYISTLAEGAVDDPAVRHTYLARAERSIERLIDIVNDLDEITRLESGVMRLQPERFDIVALASECIEIVEREARERNITITVDERQSVYVFADRRYVMQVFINLFTNSIRYGIDGGCTRVSFIDLFDKVMVEVADNGIGIAVSDQPRIFERFYRTDRDRSRDQGGTGLGLSIVKHILEAHGESIALRSELGEGTTFSFTLSKH